MSDFFSNLMARSFADAPAIQPRLPSRFETGAAGALAESQFSSEPSTAEKTAVSANLIAPPVQNIFPNLPPEKNSEIKIQDASTSEQVQPQTFSDPDAVQPVAAQVAPKSKKQFSVSEILPVPPAPDPKHFSETSRAARRRILASPFEPAASAPTINVTIGRVEVRAIQSLAPASKPARPVPPKLSLENYLQKNGGAR